MTHGSSSFARLVAWSVLLLGLSVGCGAGCDPVTPPATREMPDADRSAVVASKTQAISANGKDLVDIQVTVRKEDGTALEGRTVKVTVSGEGNTVLQPAGPTDALGVTVARVSSTVAGLKRVTASVEAEGGPVTLTSRPSLEFVVLPASRLAFTQGPTGGTAGSVLGVVEVSIQNAEGETMTGATNTVTLALGSGPAAAVLEGTVSVAAVDGVARFSELVLKKAAPAYTLVASGAGLTGTTSPSFAVAPAAPASLEVAQVAATVTAGEALSPEVSVLDVFGNRVTGYTGTVRFSSTDGSATLPADYVFTAADGGHHLFTGALVLKQAGARRLTVRDTGNAALGSTREVGVVPGAAAKLVFTGQPSDRFVRQTFGVQVALTDSFGNRVAIRAPAVTLGLNKATGTLVGHAPVTPVDGVASFSGLSIAEDDSGYVLTASGSGLTPASSNAFTITDNLAPAAPELTFTVNGLDSITVGWKAVGDDGLLGQASSHELVYSTDPGLVGALPVVLGSPRPASAPESATLSGLIPGTTYYVALKVTDNAGNSVRVTGSATTPDPDASRLVFLEQPRNGTAGVPQLAPAVQVVIQDAAGRIVSGSSLAVTLTVKGVSGFGPFTVTANKGVATFDGTQAVRIDKAGENYSLEATASTTSGTPLIPATSNLFHISHAPAARLVLSGSSPVVSGTEHSATVKVQDSFGNVAEGYRGTVTLASGDAGASLPAGHAFTATDKGEYAFPGIILRTPGTQTLTASSSDGLTSNTLEVEVSPPPPDTLVLTVPPGPVKAGDTFTLKVEVFDGFGTPRTGYTGTVRFTSTDGKATLPLEYTFTPADLGSKEFPVTLSSARELPHSITVEDKGSPSLTATASVQVTWAELARFAMDAPASARAGDPVTVKVTALDAYDNTVEDYLGMVGFSSVPADAELPADYTFSPADKGSAFFTFTPKTAASTTFTVTDAALGKSGSDTVDVTPASAMHLVMAVSPSGPVLAGSLLTVDVTAMDDFGNVATGYTGTVRFASSDVKAVLPGDTAFVPGDSGHRSFSVTLKTARVDAQSLTVKDVASASLAAETSIRVDAGPAEKLAFRDPPGSSTRVRESLGTVSVVVTDGFDNVVDVSEPEISLRLTGGNPAAVLGGMTPASPSGGIVTFGSLSVDQQGSGFQLEASGGAFAPVSSPAFSIVDDVAPSAPVLVEVSRTSVRVELQWELVGDDAMAGTASSYELRYATSPIDDSTFGSASDTGVVVGPLGTGSGMSGVITGLSPDTSYHFALRVKDDVGNASVLSVLSVKTHVDPCAGYTCTAASPTCAPDGVSRITFSSACVDVDNTPTCEETRTTTACPGTDAVCFKSACGMAVKPGANAIRVSEVMHTSSVGTTEYVELTNTTSSLLDLNGLSVTFKNSSGTTLGSFTVGSGGVPAVIDRKGTFVLAQNQDTATNGGVSADFAYGSGIDLDKAGRIQLVSGATGVEDFTYTSSFPQTTGRAMNLSSLVVGTPASAHPWYWCDSVLTALLSGGDYGTPNAANSSCGIAPAAPVDYCAIQYPKTFPSGDGVYPATVTPGSSWAIFSQFQEPGLTDRNTKGNDDYPHVFAELGYGTDATNPASWTWTAASPNAGYSSAASNNDEVKGTLSIPTAGTYKYGFRYRLLDPATGTYSPYTYCDQSGAVTPPAGTYGSVTVAIPPPPVLTSHVVISELAPAGPSGASDEFIELHNPTNADVSLSSWRLQYKGPTGGSYMMSYTFSIGAKISARGYYLLELSGGTYSGSALSNGFYSQAMGGAGGHVRLVQADGVTVVDTVGYGTANAPEGSAITGTLATSGSYERKAVSTSTATTMAVGGSDANRGNGYDSGNNANDFVLRTTRQPQNTASATEIQ
ncbi:lamin tail domain-containing protein [Archangium violaceum]|uniref:lamin tail domain-containing protein n=1 Tax=Archangium violaceum TaxID=83451 RepID=UPI002B2B97D4|nr:lamin tail domain-containing protein [Archangium gephyra]